MATVSAQIVNYLNNTLGIWYLIILNAFGVIAIIFKVTEYQLKSRKYILLCAILSFACWIFYFIMQGDFVSALINVVCVIQLVVFLQRDKYKWANNVAWMYAFLVVQVLIGVFTFKVWHDVFAVLAGVTSTIAYFVLNKRVYRYLSLISMVSWVLNSAFKVYIIALLHDSFATASVGVSLIRFELLKQDDSVTKQN